MAGLVYSLPVPPQTGKTTNSQVPTPVVNTSLCTVGDKTLLVGDGRELGGGPTCAFILWDVMKINILFCGKRFACRLRQTTGLSFQNK